MDRLVDDASSAYMAPEAFNGRRTVQTDLWSVGIILYQMLNGRLPFESPQLLSLMMAIATDTPPALPDDVPSSLRQAVLAAMDKDPTARFESAAGMRAALRDTFKQLETRSDVPAPLPRRGARTVAVTGSTRADPRRTAHRVRTLLILHLGDDTMWYCGTVGAVDECAVDYLSKERQRVIAVGYGAWDISDAMTTLLARHGVPFVNAQDVQIVNDRHAPNGRDLFFTTKADLVVVFWDGASAGIAELLAWLRKQGKDHVLGFV